MISINFLDGFRTNIRHTILQHNQWRYGKQNISEGVVTIILLSDGLAPHGTRWFADTVIKFFLKDIMLINQNIVNIPLHNV